MTTAQTNNYPYRKGVNALVIDNDQNFLIVQKKSYAQDQWDFPGGGLEDNEDPKEGILRELREELGSDNFSILHQSPVILRFEWPQDSIEAGFRKHGKHWRGQEKIQFIVKFNGSKDEINIQEDEISKVKWVELNDLKHHLIFEGQWDNARQVLEEYKSH